MLNCEKKKPIVLMGATSQRLEAMPSFGASQVLISPSTKIQTLFFNYTKFTYM